MKRVAIIGAGIAGLAAAHRLLERSAETGEPLELLIFESGSRLGGGGRRGTYDKRALGVGPGLQLSDSTGLNVISKRSERS